jgi:hypothetical protein
LNHEEIRFVGSTPAFRSILQIIASGKYGWEHFYTGGDAEAGNSRGEGSGCIRRFTQVKIISADYAD